MPEQREMGQMVDPFAVEVKREGYTSTLERHKAKAQTRNMVGKRVVGAERRLLFATMAAKGQPLQKIADAYGISRNAVSQSIEALVEEYQNKALELVGKKVARELAILDMVQLEATLAWYESKEGRVTNHKKRVKEIRSVLQKGQGMTKITSKKRTPNLPPQEDLARMFGVEPSDPNELTLADFEPNGNGQLGLDKEEEVDRHESSAGDPRFLAIIIDCHDKRAKLEGLYKGEDGRLPGQDEYARLNSEQRKGRLARLAQDLRAQKAHLLGIGDPQEAAEVTQAQTITVEDGSYTGTPR